MRKSKTVLLKKIKIGPKTQKLLILLQAGIVLSLTSRPDTFFKVIKETVKELKDIEQRVLKSAIRNLYQSKLISYKENNDGTVTIILTQDGKKTALRYNLATMAIKKPQTWDEWWRVVMFDIPERLREGRNMLASQLKRLGFISIQKSVFIFPHECKKEIEFIVEVFELQPYVRYMIVKETDIDLHLKHTFKLL